MGTSSITLTNTYTAADIENVVRRVTSDLKMIAQSSGAVTEADAKAYGEDIERLAKRGYLYSVDVTLLRGGQFGVEEKAVRYTVNTSAGDLTSSRPGGTLWPRVTNPYLRIVLSYTLSYDAAAKAAMQAKLNISWTPTNADISHSSLTQNGARDYASNAWAMQRKDYGA